MKDPKKILASLASVAGLEPIDVKIDMTDLTSGPSKPDKYSPAQDSPVGGDHAFYTYFVPGAIFQAKDGSMWLIENLPTEGNGFVRIRNVWYPREEATIPQQRVRETIDMWVYPQIQAVPALVVVE